MEETGKLENNQENNQENNSESVENNNDLKDCKKRKVNEAKEIIEDFFNGETREFFMTKHFTMESAPHLVPDKPKKMDEKAIRFIVSMVLSECTELIQTIQPDKEKALEMLKECCGIDVKSKNLPLDEIDLISDQNDALIDIIVYCQNAIVKNGVEGYSLFKEVMIANMKKRSENGKFIIRESDNKIEKPVGWTPPDIRKIVRKQFEEN